MVRVIRRLATYSAIANIAIKQYLAYRIWFWVNIFSQIMRMLIFVSIWREVYEIKEIIVGVSEGQTINYILMAQMLAPLVQWGIIFQFGIMVREGRVAIELLRPLDFQMVYYADGLARLATILLQQVLPAVFIAWTLFDLHLPTDLAVWTYFVITLLMGHAILFCFDWIFACLAFYTTETWGLYLLREGVVLFFSGSLVPLIMLPGWLQKITAALPFSQALYVPVALLAGITTVEQMPRIWLSQVLWLVGLGVLSRLVFHVAVRKVTVHGG
jgi:ABC-2 type transport system permease protein